jgi:hypothetical protein
MFGMVGVRVDLAVDWGFQMENSEEYSRLAGKGRTLLFLEFGGLENSRKCISFFFGFEG